MAFDIINPATGEKTNSFEEMSPEEVQDVLQKCAAAQRDWAETPFAERARCMKSAAHVLRTHKEDYARLMVQEMGKIYTQGIAEVEKCAWACDFYAEQAEGYLANEEVATEAEHSFVTYKPLGVVLAVMPWNFPLWQVFRFAAPALMAGNGGVLKHAPNVFGCSLLIEKLFREAGFPEHLFRSLIIDIPQAGKVLKKCVLELGGSDPFIVLEDADIDRAVAVGIVGRYQNSGQSCIAAKRFIVVDAVYEEFEKKFVDAVKALKMGDPMQEDTYIGPQARVDLRDGLHDQVQRTVQAGARLLTGGEVPTGPGAFYPATVLAGVRPGMAAWSEELFGPVATLIRVKDEKEDIEVANGTDFGLGGAVWTQDLARGERIAADGIESGAAFVNDMSRSDPRLPFGGIRNSGYGRELSIYGIREFVNVHAVWVSKPA